VQGVGPNFNQGVKSLSGGVSWDYQRKWLVDAQYTNFFGGRTYCGTDVPPPGAVVTPGPVRELLLERQPPSRTATFYSISVSYSF